MLYRDALAEMDRRNRAIQTNEAGELIWLLEHMPVYTAGTSADKAELLNPQFDVVEAGRGGRYTYHGPGQRVGYILLNLGQRGRDVRRFVHAIEGWVIATLADFGVDSWRAEGRVGIWTHDPSHDPLHDPSHDPLHDPSHDPLQGPSHGPSQGPSGAEAKIGAIGVRVRRWVTMHGFSVNLSPNLSHFSGIVPCGIEEFGVTSLAALGIDCTNAQWDAALLKHLDRFLAALEQGQGDKA